MSKVKIDRKEYQKEWVKKKRLSTNTPEMSTKEEPVDNIHPNYQSLYNYIKRPIPASEPNKMPNLERLQRIYGSLKGRRLADEVWMGNLSMSEIGEVVGELPPKF